jgi:hypothetical protein
MALRALDGEPHEQRALSHEERKVATLEAVRRVTGDEAQMAAIKARQRELSEPITQRAVAESDR